MQGMRRFPLAATTPRSKQLESSGRLDRDVIRVDILPVLCLSGVLLCVCDGGKEVDSSQSCLDSGEDWSRVSRSIPKRRQSLVNTECFKAKAFRTCLS
eukprot:14578655-Ditylum_brightwellii.AAC.1